MNALNAQKRHRTRQIDRTSPKAKRTIKSLKGIAAATPLEATQEFDIEDYSVSVVQHAPDGVLIVDKSGTIILANPAMALLTGVSPNDMVGKSVSTLIPESAREKHEALVVDYFKEPYRRPMGGTALTPMHGPNENFSPSRFEILHVDGHTVCVDVSLGPWKYRGRDYVVAFVRDASHIIKMENDLEKPSRPNASITGTNG